ncbi:MAG: DUF1566 domain-containing protein [Spirochaetes bacterium]|nr:DUF1566 domain-containing protein [Spirochaetota bacterium]
MKPLHRGKIFIFKMLFAYASFFWYACDTLEEVELANEPPPTYVKPSFLDNGNGTITDTSTNGIMWAKCAYGEGTTLCSGNAEKIPYNTAHSFCQNLALAGYTDWRLPTIAELETLSFPDADYTWFNNFGVLKNEYWFSSDLENDVFVYSIKLSTRDISKSAVDSTTIMRYARCARAVEP